MSDLEIIYSDDEDDVIDRIYFLCDLSEEKEETTPTVDLDELLRTKEHSTDETYTGLFITREEPIVKNEVIGQKVIKLLNLALADKIPQRYIFYNSNDELVNLKTFLHTKGSVDGLEYILKNYFKISVSDFVLIYYLSNIDMEEKLLISNLNDLKNITDQEFDRKRLKEYRREVEITMEETMKMMNRKLDKIKSFFFKINRLKYSNQPDDIERTIELGESEVEYFVRDGDYQIDTDSGGIIFDNMKTTPVIPFIVYLSYDNTYYKVSEDTNEIVDVMDENYIMEDKQVNHIYMFMRVRDLDNIKIKVIDLDLETSKIRFTYPGNTLVQVKEGIKKLIPDIVYVHEKKLSVNGDFEINFPGFNELKIRYLCLVDEVFSNFLYVKEVATPRSLIKNVKYYFKTYEESDSFSDHSVSFHLNKIHSNRFLLDFKSKIIKKDSINEFILILSKLITYYDSYDFEESFLDVIRTRYTGPDGVGLGGEKHTDQENYLRVNSKKLDILTKQAPGMFPTSLYGKSCPCNRQPIIINDKDVEDWEEYQPPDIDRSSTGGANGDKRNVVLFPPEESKQKSKKFHFVCPENKYPYLYFLKNPSFGEKYPILPCCGTTQTNEYIEDYDLIRKDEIDYMAKKNQRRVRKEIKLKTIKILSPDQIGVLPQQVIKFLNTIREGNFVRRGVFHNNTSSLIHCVLTAASHLDSFLEKIDPRNTEMLNKIKNLKNIRDSYMTRNIKDKENIVNGFRDKITSFVNLESSAQETYQYDIKQVHSFIQDREKVFNSELYYRLLEHIFMLNIFVFTYQNGEVEIENPRHNFYHIRQYNQYFPTLFIFKHITARSIPTYELIKDESYPSSPFLRKPEFLKYMRNFIRAKNYAVGVCEKNDFSVIKNGYSGIRWNMILKDYKILSQDLSDSGRMIKINIGIGGGLKMTIFVKPSVPLNVKVNRMIYESKREDVVRIFGEEYIVGSEGLWYSLKGFSHGIFIPCKEIKASSRREICLEYELLRSIFKSNQQINTISIIKKNANIIKQLIIWLWSLDRDIDDVDEWFEIYTTVMTEKKLIDIINTTPIKIEYRFPADINTTEDGISYLENYIPLMFNLGKIHLYQELLTTMRRFVKNYQLSLSGYPKTTNKSIVNLFNGEKDFKRHLNTRLILGKDKYEQYYNGIKNIKMDIEQIPDTNSVKVGVFPYRSSVDNMYFLVQNTSSDRKGEAILCSYIWDRWNINLGYRLDRTKIWKMFEEHPFLADLLGYSVREVIDYSNEQTPIDTTDYTEALYFLAKNDIPVPDDRFPLGGKQVNIRYRNSDGYYDKLVSKSDGEMVNVWVYGNGVYAGMLEIS